MNRMFCAIFSYSESKINFRNKKSAKNVNAKLLNLTKIYCLKSAYINSVPLYFAA